MSDNEIYLLIKYIKSVLWRVAKCLSYIEEARCLKVNKGKRKEEDRSLGKHRDRHCVYYWQTKFLNPVKGPGQCPIVLTINVGLKQGKDSGN